MDWYYVTTNRIICNGKEATYHLHKHSITT